MDHGTFGFHCSHEVFTVKMISILRISKYFRVFPVLFFRAQTTASNVHTLLTALTVSRPVRLASWERMTLWSGSTLTLDARAACATQTVPMGKRDAAEGPQLADPWVEDVFWAMGGIVVRMPLRASAVDGRMAGFKS